MQYIIKFSNIFIKNKIALKSTNYFSVVKNSRIINIIFFCIIRFFKIYIIKLKLSKVIKK